MSSQIQPHDVPGQVLHGLFLTGLDSWATIHIEPGMPPAHHHIDQIFRDLLSGKENFKDLSPEQLFQISWDKPGRHPEHAFSIETSIRAQDMAVKVETQEIPKGLDGNDGAGDGILLWDKGTRQKEPSVFLLRTRSDGEESSRLKTGIVPTILLLLSRDGLARNLSHSEFLAAA